MNLVMLSTDARLFEEGNAKTRMQAYGSIVGSLTVVVFGKGRKRAQKLAPNVEVVFLGGGSKLSSLVKSFSYLLALTKKSHVDLVSSQDPFILGLVGLTVSKLRGIPLQVQIHTDCFSLAYSSESLRRAIEAVVAHLVVQGASGIRVVSKRIESEVKKRTARPVFVIPIQNTFGPVSGQPKPSSFKDDFTFVTISRLTKEKQICLIIDALTSVQGASLVIVGEGPERKRLEKRVQKRKLKNQVTFVGWQGDIKPYLEHASAYVSASRYEGFGLALFEAARFGKAIVTTDVGIVGEVLLNGTDALVVKGTVEGLSLGMRRVMDEPSLSATLGASARHSAEAYAITEETYLLRYKEALQACVTK